MSSPAFLTKYPAHEPETAVLCVSRYYFSALLIFASLIYACSYKCLAMTLVIFGALSSVICAYDFASDNIVPLVTGVEPNAIPPNCSATTIAPLT